MKQKLPHTSRFPSLFEVLARKEEGGLLQERTIRNGFEIKVLHICIS
jgi:hypothetical protein